MSGFLATGSVRRCVTKPPRVPRSDVSVRDSVPRFESLDEQDAKLWVASVALFGLGDLVTTGVGLSVAGVAETNHAVATLVGSHGFGTFVALKGLVLLAFYGVSTRLPSSHAVGVPMALTTLGLAVTLWNCLVVAVALLS